MSKEFKQLFSTLIDGWDKHCIEEYLNQKTEDINDADKQYISRFYNNHIRPKETIIEGMILAEIIGSNQVKHKSDIEFIYLHYEFVNHHIQSLFQSIEGSAFSADRSHHLIEKLNKHFIDGEEIELDLENKQAYWIGKIILRNHNDIIEMFKAVKAVYYGDSRLLNTVRIKMIGLLSKEVKNEKTIKKY